jgi:hypothetical protein
MINIFHYTLFFILSKIPFNDFGVLAVYLLSFEAKTRFVNENLQIVVVHRWAKFLINLIK